MGALEARWLLQIGGCRADVVLVEAGGLPFWTDTSGSTLNLSAAAPVPAATLPAGRTDVLDGLKPYLPNITPAICTIHSGFADGSGLAEVPALLLGGPALTPGGPVVHPHGEVLAENVTFRNLIGPQHMAVIEAMAAERRAVARKFGVRDLPDTEDWLDQFAGAASGEGSRPVPDQAHASALVRCAVIGSLTPLVSAAAVAGVATPATEGMINLASAMLGADLATAGRKLGGIGIEAGDLDTARRALEVAARGNA